MASELEKICHLLLEGSAEIQCAAALILGELRPKDPQAKKALVQALKSTNETVQLYSVQALARIDAPSAVPHLVPLLSGPEAVRTRVTQTLESLGPVAAPGLREHLSSKDALVRKGVVEILGRMKEVDTADALFAALLDPDLEVVRKAAQAYRQRLEGMTEPEKVAALKKILDFMGSPRVRKVKTPLASCLLIVGALRNPSAARPVLQYLDSKQPPAVRNHALLALGSLPLEKALVRPVVRALLPLLDEADFGEIVKPAIDVLTKLPLGPEEQGPLLRLLRSAQPAVRHFALRALGQAGTPRAGEALAGVLEGDDPRQAEAAAGALRSNPDFAPLLVKALERQKDPEKQWRIVHVLRAFRNVLDKATVRKFLSKALGMLEKKQSGFQVYVDVVRTASPEALREIVLKRGRELLAKKRVEDAERTLRILERDDLASAESDLALGIAILRSQNLDLAGAGRDRGPALHLFSKLARREDFPFIKRLEKEANLVTPEGLLYLGFAFVERQGAERDAGAQVLKLVARKFGSREAGKIARQKLKTQGAG
jgi:HEAT repeat protein